MALEKVIQDSDDEDYEEETPTSADPLQHSRPSPSNDGGVSSAAGSEEAHFNVARQSVEDPSPKVTSSNGLDVNFDDFLQSQSPTKRASISPLQSRQAQVPEESDQTPGGTGNAQPDFAEPRPQSLSSSKLKRTQTIASLDEIELRRSDNSKKKAKRFKTTDLERSNPPSKQRLSSGGDGVHAGGERHIPEDVENKTSKEMQEINDTDTPLNGENVPQKSSIRRGRTLGNDNVSNKGRQKTSRRCASTITKDMDDAWDRDQFDFKAGDVQKDAVNVEITTAMTRSQEQEYETLNGEISQNSHCHTIQEKDSEETNLIPDQTYNGRGKPPSTISHEDPENAVEEYRADANDHNFLMGQESTPRQENTTQMVVAISPHDTEELSSFNSVHVRRSSLSPMGDPSQPTPEDPFDESPPRQTMQRKPGRKRRAAIIDDSDESPDELNPPVDPPKQKRKLQSSRTGSEHTDADVQDNDDDIIKVPPEKRDSHGTSHGEKPITEGVTEPVEEPQPADFEGTNSDGMDMPPKEQYKPRPSRSRGKPTEPEPERPEVSQKGSRKKKVKRGKTTSAMLKKSVESDIEDDVVWVDEKPADVVFHDPVLPGKRKAKRGKTNDAYVEHQLVGDEGEGTVADREPNPVEQPEKPMSNKVQEPNKATKPAPKKRGRKPKKTTEPLVTAETQAEELKSEQKNDEISNLETEALPNDSEKAVDPPAEQQDEPLPDPPTDNHDNKPSSTPEPKNRKPSPPETAPAETPPPVETPKKQTTTAKTPSATEETMTPPPNSSQKAPSKHSPISTSASVPYRVGLSRRANIAPLLKVVRK